MQYAEMQRRPYAVVECALDNTALVAECLQIKSVAAAHRAWWPDANENMILTLFFWYHKCVSV